MRRWEKRTGDGSNISAMKFTVITIAYNEEKNIAETMQSVLSQDYKDLEYLVIDGASSDHTVETAQKLAEESARDVKIYSEPDFGIYNAMNRGITRASGDYVIFMNAGDCFYNTAVLSNIAREITQNRTAIYYGQAFLMKNGRCQRIKNYSKEIKSVYDALLRGWIPVHQSIAAPTSVLKSNYFDEVYAIRADYDWIIKCHKNGIGFIDLNFPVCRYDCSGISSRTKFKKRLWKETTIIRRKHYPVMARIYEWFGY